MKRGLTTLYRFFDATGQLLYVGITGRQSRRARDHRRHASWWDLASAATFERFAYRSVALAAEREAIAAERPIHNRLRPADSSVQQLVWMLRGNRHLQELALRVGSRETLAYLAEIGGLDADLVKSA